MSSIIIKNIFTKQNAITTALESLLFLTAFFFFTLFHWNDMFFNSESVVVSQCLKEQGIYLFCFLVFKTVYAHFL